MIDYDELSKPAKEFGHRGHEVSKRETSPLMRRTDIIGLDVCRSRGVGAERRSSARKCK